MVDWRSEIITALELASEASAVAADSTDKRRLVFAYHRFTKVFVNYIFIYAFYRIIRKNSVSSKEDVKFISTLSILLDCKFVILNISIGNIENCFGHLKTIFPNKNSRYN